MTDRVPPRQAASVGGDVDYGQGGDGYAVQRRADPRIAAMIHAELGDAQTVLNVGAGAGSYEPRQPGITVIAVEPSAAMRSQRPPNLVPAIDAYAEALPLADQSVDAAMATVTVHQWADKRKGLAELCRVTRGPIVVLAFVSDARGSGHEAGSGAAARFWLGDYAPELVAVEQRRDPPLALLRDGLSVGRGGTARTVTARPVPVPSDCTDGFTDAFYARPERLLDPRVRAAQSSWRFVEPAAQDRFVQRLSADLASGEWRRRYGHYLAMPTFEGALHLIVSRPT